MSSRGITVIIYTAKGERIIRQKTRKYNYRPAKTTRKIYTRPRNKEDGEEKVANYSNWETWSALMHRSWQFWGHERRSARTETSGRRNSIIKILELCSEMLTTGVCGAAKRPATVRFWVNGEYLTAL